MNYLDTQQVALRYNVATLTIRRAVTAGKFPAPLKVGRLLRWRESDLLEWEQAQLGVAAAAVASESTAANR